MDGARSAMLEKVNGVALALGFEELPDRFGFEELRGFRLHFLHVMEELQSFWIALGQKLFEIAFESEMTAVEHERVHVAPHFGQVWNFADTTVQIGCGGDWKIGSHFPAATIGTRGLRLRAGDRGGLAFPEDVRRQDLFARRWVHDFV